MTRRCFPPTRIRSGTARLPGDSPKWSTSSPGRSSRIAPREFTLVNVARERDERGGADVFARGVSQRGLFRRVTWEEVNRLDPLLRPCLGRQTLGGEPAFPEFR